MRRMILMTAGVTSLALTAGEALALRCDGWVVAPGQSQFEVGERCGNPQASDHRIEWRVQTIFQQQCQNLTEPVYLPGPPHAADKGGAAPPTVVYRTRTVCTSVPISYTVPVEVDIWYFDDVSVPKALHFENGRLIWVEPLWRLRHPN